MTMTECDATVGDLQIYYHGNVIPLGAYVIDSNEELGSGGDAAHRCLLENFRTFLARELNCTVIEIVAGFSTSTYNSST